MTACPTMRCTIITPGKQRRRIPMSPISSTLNGLLLQACTLLAPPIDHLLLWVEVRPTIPSRPCSKAFPPSSKVQQTQTQMFKVDRKGGISGPSSIQLTSTAQNSHLRIRFLTTSITTFTIIIIHGFSVPDPQAVATPSLQQAGSGLRMVLMHLRTIEP